MGLVTGAGLEDVAKPRLIAKAGWVTVFVFSVLCVAAFKNDSENIVGRGWSGLKMHDWVLTLTRLSPLLLGGAIIASAIELMINKRLRLLKNSAVATLALAIIVSAVRLLEESALMFAKQSAGLLIFLFVYAYLSMAVARLGSTCVTAEFHKGAFWAACAVIAVNILNVATGNGYIVNAPRLYGTTVHPNFLGVQLALCLLAVVTFRFKARWKNLVALAPLVVACLYLIVMTGSRTSLVMVATGILCAAFYADMTQSARTIAMVGLLALVGYAAALALQPAVDLAIYDRGTGGSDTRTRVWGIMWDSFTENPMFGAGILQQASENSYLRALASFGLLYSIPFLLCVAFTYKRIMSRVRRDKHRANIFMTCLFFSLLAGGMLEGYLVDTFSLPLVLFFMVVVISGFKRRLVVA